MGESWQQAQRAAPSFLGSHVLFDGYFADLIIYGDLDSPSIGLQISLDSATQVESVQAPLPHRHRGSPLRTLPLPRADGSAYDLASPSRCQNHTERRPQSPRYLASHSRFFGFY